MRERIVTMLAAVLLILALAGALQADPLTPKQQKVLDYLVANWGIDTAVTGIDLAMEIVGGDYTLEDRYALGVYIREHPEVHRIVRFFGWETVALTPTEKRIARVLARHESEQQPAPSLAELARKLEVQPRAITEGLGMLERFGIIREDTSADGVGYRMAKSRYVNWEGGMRITFMAHRVNVHGLKQFDTYWAIDFLALVNAKWLDKKVTISDSSQYSGTPIHLVMDQGQVTELNPATTRVFLGGGWGINNLFGSEEEVQKWLAHHPELRTREVYGVQEFLDKHRRGEINELIF